MAICHGHFQYILTAMVVTVVQLILPVYMTCICHDNENGSLEIEGFCVLVPDIIVFYGSYHPYYRGADLSIQQPVGGKLVMRQSGGTNKSRMQI